MGNCAEDNVLQDTVALGLRKTVTKKWSFCTNYVTKTLGQKSVVVDSDDLLADPGLLGCFTLTFEFGIPLTEDLLLWIYLHYLFPQKLRNHSEAVLQCCRFRLSRFNA